MGKLSQTGSLSIEVVSLDECVLERSVPIPNVIKMDIDGSEYVSLLGVESLIEKHHPTIFLATHGPEVPKQYCDYLAGKGYGLEAIGWR